MRYDPDRHHRRSIRLRGYDYTAPGAYFVTVCTYQKACLLGHVVDGEMRLNDAGRVVQETWGRLPERFPSICLDAFVAMPNHVHGIILLAPGPQSSSTIVAPRIVVWAQFIAPRPPGIAPKSPGVAPREETGVINHAPTVGEIIRAFKAASTRGVRQSAHEGFGWQRNYYEHVVRGEEELRRIREYIVTNPTQWAQDPENPSPTQ